MLGRGGLIAMAIHLLFADKAQTCMGSAVETSGSTVTGRLYWIRARLQAVVERSQARW